MKKRVSTCLILLSVLFFSSCQKKSYSYEEAVRSLKILNGDMLNLFSGIAEKDEIKALNFLWNQSTSPVPYKKEEFSIGKQHADYDFAKLKGIYNWNPDNQAFEKTDESTEVEVITPQGISGVSSTQFKILKFDQVDISSRPMFPLEIIAALFHGNDKILSINHSAAIEDDLPLNINSEIKGTDYGANINFKRTRQEENGTVIFTIDLKQKNIQFIQLNVNAEIGYSNLGYYFKEIRFKGKFFNHQMNGEINYQDIDPTAKDYVNSWNSNSLIEIVENGKNKVGNVVLGTSSDGELHNYFVQFSNGKKELLVDYLPFLDKILNFKY